MAGPLTLNWNCARTCTPTAVSFDCTSSYVNGVGVGITLMVLSCLGDSGYGNQFVGPPDGFNTAGIGIGALNPAIWSTLRVTFTIDASLFQVGATSPAVWTVSGVCIKITYSCIDPNTGLPLSTMVVRVPPDGGGFAQCETGPGDIRSTVSFGGGGGVGTMYKSTPLGACNGSSVSGGGFGAAPPNPNNPPGNVQCLCASGGTPPYGPYTVQSGVMPDGLVLDPNSGCISGTPTTPGSYPVVFGITDSAGGSVTLPVTISVGSGSASSSICGGGCGAIECFYMLDSLIGSNFAPWQSF